MMMKIACIYHSIDLDGWMSAAIVEHWFSQQEVPNKQGEDCNTINFIGYNYGDPIPDLSEYNKVIMCDISFPMEEMIKLWEKLGVNNMIWIDHHISAIKNIQDTKWLWEGSQDTKFAACELTWKYFFPNEPMPEIVRLLGRYDCFGHKGTDEEQYVLEFQYGARQCISNYEDAYNYLHNCLLQEKSNTIENSIWLNGKSIYQYLCTEAKQAYKNGFEVIFNKSIVNKQGTCPYCGAEEISHNSSRTMYSCNTTSYDDRPGTFKQGIECKSKTYNFICINKERFNPINFGIDYHKDGYDGAACFHYANGMWNFSLYNDNEQVDCSIIAKQYGGGGHRGASGFRIKNINDLIK